MRYKVWKESPVNFLTLKECLDDVCPRFNSKIAFKQIIDKNAYKDITFSQFYEDVVALGAYLISIGFKNKKIGIIGEDSIHWIEAYMATVCGVGVAVPIDKELDTETMAYQVDFADCEAVFISEKTIKKLPELQRLCHNVRCWFVMCHNPEKEMPAGATCMEDLLGYGNNLTSDDKNSFINAQVKPDDLCDIVFTSGTTGVNKGVMLSHRNVSSVVKASLAHIWVKKETIACLPINHAYEKNCHVLPAIALGNTLVINDDLMHLAGNLQKYHPHASIMVPMLLETLERRIRAELKKRGEDKRVEKGMQMSNMLRKVGIDKRSKFFGPILSVMGGDLEQIVVGGAPLKEESWRFFDSLGVSIINGYGITECAPLVAANYTDYQKMGSVGNVIPGCEVRIIDPDEKGEGTVYVRGDNVMMGYYKDDESTRKVLSEDGWLNTGDLGHFDRDGFLYLSGRVKNLIILSNGKNVSPEELEEKICIEMPYVSETVVFADDKGTGIYGMVYLDKEFLTENHIENVKARLSEDLAKMNHRLPSYKRIVDLTISDTEFAKTTTKKIQRFKVKKVYSKD